MYFTRGSDGGEISPPGMATRVRPTYRRRYSCSSIVCRPTWLLSSALSPPYLSQCHYRDANRSCILELRTNQCFVCNFLCMPRCMSQIAPKKPQCLCCFTRTFRNMLTPFQVASDSKKVQVGKDQEKAQSEKDSHSKNRGGKSKLFGGSNQFVDEESS